MKKLNKSEQEFLVNLITDKIVEKKQKQLDEIVNSNSSYVEFKKRVDEMNILRDNLFIDFEQLKKQLDFRVNLYSCSKVDFRVDSICYYTIRKEVEKKVMYEQIVLGGISENLIDKIVEELS